MPALSQSSRVLWLVFISVSVAWGSSYFFIKVGIESGLQPFTLIAWRLGISIVALGIAVAVTGSRAPRDLAVLGKLAVMGVFYVGVPFTLITWAERIWPDREASCHRPAPGSRSRSLPTTPAERG